MGGWKKQSFSILASIFIMSEILGREEFIHFLKRSGSISTCQNRKTRVPVRSVYSSSSVKPSEKKSSRDTSHLDDLQFTSFPKAITHHLPDCVEQSDEMFLFGSVPLLTILVLDWGSHNEVGVHATLIPPGSCGCSKWIHFVLSEMSKSNRTLWQSLLFSIQIPFYLIWYLYRIYLFFSYRFVIDLWWWRLFNVSHFKSDLHMNSCYYISRTCVGR